MAIFVRNLSNEDKIRLEELKRSSADRDLAKRAKIILLSAMREGVLEISAEVGLHPINVRKWIHRYNRMGLNGLYPRRSPGRPRLFSEQQRKEIIGLASTNPSELGLDFHSWSLQRLRQHLIDQGITDEISAETIRQELLRGGLIFEERRWVDRD